MAHIPPAEFGREPSTSVASVSFAFLPGVCICMNAYGYAQMYDCFHRNTAVRRC